MDIDSKIEKQILDFATSKWQKVAMIVANVIIDNYEELIQNGVDDSYVSSRVKKLVQNGKLVSRGNLDEIRFSEIRLPESK